MFLSHLSIAFDSYLQAFRLVSKHKLWPLFLWSGLIYLLIIIGGAYGVWAGMHSISDAILDIGFIKKWSNYVALKWVFQILIWGIYIASFFVFFSFYKYVLLILASPLYSYISEKTASVISSKQFTFSANQLLIDIMRGIRLSIRNFIRQTLLSILLLVLSLIPIVGLISALLFILLDSYYYGFAMMDYTCERDKMTSKESIAFVQNNKGLAVGNGLVFYGLFLIPVIGIMIGAPLSVIAATISMHKK
jgi:CysZ protein